MAKARAGACFVASQSEPDGRGHAARQAERAHARRRCFAERGGEPEEPESLPAWRGRLLRRPASSPRTTQRPAGSETALGERRGVAKRCAGKEARNRGGEAGSLIAGEQIGPQATGHRARRRRKTNLHPGAPQHLAQVHGRIGSRPHKLSPVRRRIIQLFRAEELSPAGRHRSCGGDHAHRSLSGIPRALDGLVEGGGGDFGSLPKQWTRHATAA